MYILEDACSVFLAHSTSLAYASISKNLIYFASLPLICLFFLRYYYCSYKTFIASYISSSFLLIYNSTRRSSFYIIDCIIVIVIINFHVAKQLIKDWQNGISHYLYLFLFSSWQSFPNHFEIKIKLYFSFSDIMTNC